MLAATPIGNAEDASYRLVKALESAHYVAAEDTRQLSLLCQRLQLKVSGKMLSYHEHNEQARAKELVSLVSAGAFVLVVSDAGMPSVSDPGYRVVVEAVTRGVPVTVLPGASAVLTALTLSGFPTDRFCFEGFLPRKAGEKNKFLSRLAEEERTMVFFESPHRIAESLTEMAAVFGEDRQVAVCRELTKKFEEVVRGTLAEVANIAQEEGRLRGEICLVLAGADPIEVSVVQLLPEVESRVAKGERLKQVVKELAATHGVSQRELYQLALENKD